MFIVRHVGVIGGSHSSDSKEVDRESFTSVSVCSFGGNTVSYFLFVGSCLFGCQHISYFRFVAEMSLSKLGISNLSTYLPGFLQQALICEVHGEWG